MATIFGWWGPVFCHGQSGGLLLRVDHPRCDRLGALYHLVDAVQLKNKTKRFVCLCLVEWGSLLTLWLHLIGQLLSWQNLELTLRLGCDWPVSTFSHLMWYYSRCLSPTGILSYGDYLFLLTALVSKLIALVSLLIALVRLLTALVSLLTALVNKLTALVSLLTALVSLLTALVTKFPDFLGTSVTS